MVSSRFTSFIFVLAFLLYQSSAEKHQDTEKIDHVAARKSFPVDGGSPFGIGKDIFDAVPTPGEASNLKVGGRKMMKRRFLIEGKDTMIDLEASKFYSATDSNAVNRTKEKRKLNKEFDMKVQGPNYLHVKRGDLSSFVALNADYHPPKSHPPKNN
ncbi:uncharacterized protein LOC141710974 [Apium graveolens]|uniref:uncharacterized protein LOC141710974 n=1 Tax=Apium graveolens TaxID=4045 RepID=UPI003D7C013D